MEDGADSDSSDDEPRIGEYAAPPDEREMQRAVDSEQRHDGEGEEEESQKPHENR